MDTGGIPVSDWIVWCPACDINPEVDAAGYCKKCGNLTGMIPDFKKMYRTGFEQGKKAAPDINFHYKQCFDHYHRLHREVEDELIKTKAELIRTKTKLGIKYKFPHKLTAILETDLMYAVEKLKAAELKADETEAKANRLIREYGERAEIAERDAQILKKTLNTAVNQIKFLTAVAGQACSKINK